ncbi:MAG: NACHT domain-containing protein [Symploca sp. SIO2B6]|nr:NACHT domain-containing protein [Symploca sp. SIO2B6]
MTLNLRNWLVEHHMELIQLRLSGSQLAGIAFRIAQDMEIKSLTPFNISVLTEVLELPFQAAWQAAAPISRLSVSLLRILNRKRPLKRNEGTWLTFQVAYLNALQEIVEQESQLKRVWANRAEVPTAQGAVETLSNPQLLALVKTLRPGRLTDSQAEQALSIIADSFLVQQMNNLAKAWFVANGAEETEAQLLTQRLSHGLPGHLLTVIAENPLPLAQLQKFVRLGNLSSWRDPATHKHSPGNPEFATTGLSSNLNREYYRARLLQSLSEPLLAELFSLQDLYVPLKGVEVHLGAGKVLEATNASGRLGYKQPAIFTYPMSEDFPVSGVEKARLQDNSQPQTSLLPLQASPPKAEDLMKWAMSQLEDHTSIAVIEAEPGGGKTSFCQIWAAQIAREVYPRWMPVLIRLRDVSLGQTLEQTLDTALPIGRFSDRDGWLSSIYPPCLLILDGLDELAHSPRKSSQLRAFLNQVMLFNQQHLDESGLPRHKLILTSRSTTLDCLIGNYWHSSRFTSPVPLRRMAIQPFAQDEFRQWFQQWAKLGSRSIAQAYFNFLKHGKVFQKQPIAKELATLVKRPLLLYLLGILHRDALVDKSIFQMNASELKFEIYERICRWLLGETAAKSNLTLELLREGLAHASRSAEAIANLLQGRHPQYLRRQMQVAALTILQTSQYQVPQTEIEKRLFGELATEVSIQPLPALFFHSGIPKGLKGERLKLESYNLYPENTSEEKPLTSSSPNSIIEFSHPNLGEYLAAQEIAAQLMKLTQEIQDQYGEITYVINDQLQVAKHLYALLGYGLLSNQVEELVIEGLRRQEKRNAKAFSFRVLFQCLYRFYRAYCRGRWLDEGIAHQTHSQLQVIHNSLNVLQIDAAVGINVFLLLCSGARAAQIPFWPCGNPDIPSEFDAEQLLSFIGRTTAISTTAFWQRVRHSLVQLQLAGACLNRAMLAEANLSRANLSAAELIGLNLRQANLQNADLSWSSLAGTNLTDANLSGASLEGADLSGVNLTRATLTKANLANACLFQAQLDPDNREFAKSNGAIFSLEEFQTYKHSLVPKFSFTEDDKLSGEETTILVESAEGEPILPDAMVGNGLNEYNRPTEVIKNHFQEQKVSSEDEEDDEDAYADTVIIPPQAQL